MTTIDIWVNKKLEIIGIVMHNSWLPCSAKSLLHVIQSKHKYKEAYVCERGVIIYNYKTYPNEKYCKYFNYTTISFDSLDRLLLLLSQQHPELLL